MKWIETNLKSWIAFPGIREWGGVAEYDGGARVDWQLAEEVGRGDESRASGIVIGLLVPG